MNAYCVLYLVIMSEGKVSSVIFERMLVKIKKGILLKKNTK